jgi:hypothetical protein
MPANEKSPLHGLLIAPQAVQPASIRSVGAAAWAAVLGVPIAIAPTFIGHFRDDGYNYSQQPEPFLVSGVVGGFQIDVRSHRPKKWFLLTPCRLAYVLVQFASVRCLSVAAFGFI